MSVQPDHLVTFATVVREGSVTRAATVLHRSQPAISLQLKKLAEAVGEPLLVRHRHGVTPTATGAALLPHAQAVARALAGARRSVGEIRRLERGDLWLTASMTVAVYLLPEVLVRFRERHPGLQIHLLTRNSREALRELADGAAELAFVEGPPAAPPPGMSQRVVFHDEVVLAVRPDHPLAARRAVHARDLGDMQVVTREPGSGTREVVERALAAAGPRLGDIALEATGIEAVKEAVLQGVGPGFISRLALRREVGAGLLVALPVAGLDLRRPMSLVHPPAETCSRAARAFLAFLTGLESGEPDHGAA